MYNMSFIFNGLNDKLLIKRFREQILFDRFQGVDFRGEIVRRMEAAGVYGCDELIDQWINQWKFGEKGDIDLKLDILERLKG